MRVAVISDIHGNFHALEAVLEAIAAESTDAIWCLGDIVGYGPRPNRCCAIVEERAALCLVGNHDLGSLGRVDLTDFSDDAAFAANWTGSVLERESRRFLESLDPSGAAGEVAMYHASPRDPIWEYVIAPGIAAAAFDTDPSAIILVGHSHVPLALKRVDSGVEGGLAAGGTEIAIGEGERWLLNPGAVGQPRDGDPRAAWLLLDLELRLASFRRAEYAIERTQAEIRERGLPETLAGRLAIGI